MFSMSRIPQDFKNRMRQRTQFRFWMGFIGQLQDVFAMKYPRTTQKCFESRGGKNLTFFNWTLHLVILDFRECYQLQHTDSHQN